MTEAFLLLLGVGGAEFTGAESAAYLVPWQLLGIALGAFCLLRGSRVVGLVGLFIPLVAVIGAVRVATQGQTLESQLSQSSHKVAGTCTLLRPG